MMGHQGRSRAREGDQETEDERRAFLALASIYKIDLLAFGTEQPDGSVTLDWDELKAAVMARMSSRDAV